ncbi:MAG: fructosamine kinase family protein [Gammaproteobacteria bacterium]|nr:fructosamine kinase family protein [Pseudomonadales bacterium]MCP5349155.1 fructosamine kinase family protein [Pseudomonadales bacterium]
MSTLLSCDYITIMDAPGNLQAVGSWLRDNHSVEILQFEAVAGGCINRTGRLTLSNGRRLFVKYQTKTPADFFAAEAHGLGCLRQATDLRVPAVVHADREFLLLEDLGSGARVGDFWTRLGEGLAQLHRDKHTEFGLERDNYCGLTRQHNPTVRDGFDFFARHRLDELADRARQTGLLENRDRRRLEILAATLRDWLPEQPPVLIHGDLWSGNVHCDGRGNPALIDPACYRGWAEAELAMTTLFGGFPESFYQAYEAASAIDPGWRERAPLYNLYHLLNHLLLFGGGYLAQIRSVLSQYV